MSPKPARSWCRIPLSILMSLVAVRALAVDVSVRGELHADQPGALVSRNLFGQFSDGMKASSVGGQILTAPEITSHNTFDRPDTVKPAAFHGAQVDGGGLTVALPAKSIVMLQLR
jgi:hypothetical protein